jgi:hypothetical protein
MPVQEHSTIREGITTGLIGALIIALWYALWDLLAGRPLFTFDVLGRIFIDAQIPTTAGPPDMGAAAGFLVLLVVLCVLAGLGLTLLTHLAARNPALRMGVWLGLVIAFCYLLGLTHMLNLWTGGRLPLWEVLGGATLGVLTMAVTLWRRHPRLARSFDEAPLGDEVRTPGHAPGGPRV